MSRNFPTIVRILRTSSNSFLRTAASSRQFSFNRTVNHFDKPSIIDNNNNRSGIRTMTSNATVRRIIKTKDGPEPVGPYNQAVLFDKTVYLSGVLGLDKDKKALVEGGTAAQAKQALINMGHILKAAGSSYDGVIKTTIFLAKIEDFSAVNEVYKEFFKTNFPARSTFQVARLPLDALVEIEAIAGTGIIKQETCGCGN